MSLNNLLTLVRGGKKRGQDIAAPQEIVRHEDEEIRVYDAGLSKDIVLRGKILPYEESDDKLSITDDIKKLLVLTDVGQFIVSRTHERSAQVASFRAKALAHGYKVEEPELADLLTINALYELTTKRTSALSRDKTETRMQRLVIDLIAQAARANASDIHIIANQETAQVRMRVDGAMMDYSTPLPGDAFDLQATAFAMADSSDATYQPLEVQGARISRHRTELPPRVQAVRLQWDPLAFNGRVLIMRLLYSGQTNTSDIDKLGYAADHIELIRLMRAMPEGIVIISGPTGSGKSTTLKVSLDRLIFERNREINVLTVEDPPEYVISYANQIPVMNTSTQEDRRAAFQKVISAAMRSDPDVIMIGEIRDTASAKLAFEGAMTGHGIWTSVHANDAFGILDRLRDMDIEPYKLWDPNIIRGLIGQRLVRCLCPFCSVTLQDALKERRDAKDGDRERVHLLEPAHIERLENALAAAGRDVDDVRYASAKGCEKCAQKGYRGRSVIAEIIMPDQGFMDLASKGDKAGARLHWIEKLGGITMRSHGFGKILTQTISPIDLENATGPLVFQEHMRPYLKRLEAELATKA